MLDINGEEEIHSDWILVRLYFFNWNRVKLRYCDGASFSGDGQNEAAQLQFRGERIWRAAIDDLKANGMRYADQALLSGCSAGGLAAILRCDEFRNLFPGSTKVKCLSDAGLFLDTTDVLDKDFIKGDLSHGEPHVEGLFLECFP
ncbi:unnamed protein product [Brassica oleracea]